MAIDISSVNTDDGADQETKLFGSLVSDAYIKYFKLGEGGWNMSASAHTETFDTGDGTDSYSGVLTRLPVGKTELTVTAGSQTCTDDGAGNLTGDGTGTINYKTGAVSVTFDSTVTIGGAVEATYKYWGSESSDKTRVIATGNDTIGPYYGSVFFRPVVPSSVSISDGGSQTVTDDGSGNLVGDGDGTIDYETGEINMIFDAAVVNGNEITATYKYDGAPKTPDPTKTDLESESDPDLYTFQRDFVSGDIVFSGEASGTIVCNISLEKYEGIDDGNGNPPYFFEGGIFAEDDTMLMYFTMSKVRNDGSTEINLNVDVVI